MKAGKIFLNPALELIIGSVKRKARIDRPMKI
jgi:hypothetical protein